MLETISTNKKARSLLGSKVKPPKDLHSLNQKAKEYIKRTIVDMEMEQIAESIMRVTKRVLIRRGNESLAPILAEAKQNRPTRLLTSAHSKKAAESGLSDYLFEVEFDSSVGLEDLWIDA